MPDEPLPGRPVDHEQFRAAVVRAGLGDLPADELDVLRRYYDDWRAQVAQLRPVLDLADEPATIFVAGSRPPADAADSRSRGRAGRPDGR